MALHCFTVHIPDMILDVHITIQQDTKHKNHKGQKAQKSMHVNHTRPL